MQSYIHATPTFEQKKKLKFPFELNICVFVKCDFFFQIVEANYFTKLLEIDPYENVVD